MILRDISILRAMYKDVSAIAAEEGKYFSLDVGFRDKLNFLIKPERIIENGDSRRLIEAKTRLISKRSYYFRRHLVGGLCMFVGAVLGVIVANVLKTLLT